jgi:hypothetical protein
MTKRGFIWGENILPLLCSKKEMPIGHIGPREMVLHHAQDMKKDFVQFVCQLVNDEEKEPEFDNFFIVYAVMEKLGKMVERGRLGCGCGNKNIAVEILPDKIELVCERCDALGIIHTDKKAILDILDTMGSIYLEENTTWIINGALQDRSMQKNN